MKSINNSNTSITMIYINNNTYSKIIKKKKKIKLCLSNVISISDIGRDLTMDMFY